MAPAALEAAGWAGALLILGVAGDDNAPIALAPVVLVVIALLLIPVFALGLFMDARTTRVDSADGGPNPYLWGLAGLLVPIAGLVWTTYSFLIPIAVLYLYRRPTVALASDVLDGDAQAESADEVVPVGRISNWWYGVAVPIVLYAVLVASLTGLEALTTTTGGTPPHLDPKAGLGGATLVTGMYAAFSLLVLFLFAPVFSLALYKDVRAVRAAALDWSPNPYLYGAVALLHLLSTVVSMVTLVTLPAGLIYLVQRHRHVGRP